MKEFDNLTFYLRFLFVAPLTKEVIGTKPESLEMVHTWIEETRNIMKEERSGQMWVPHTP